MTEFLACVCVKLTKDMLSDIYHIMASNPYDACTKLQEISGIKIDGKTNYMDFVHLDNERRDLWERGYIA